MITTSRTWPKGSVDTSTPPAKGNNSREFTGQNDARTNQRDMVPDPTLDVQSGSGQAAKTDTPTQMEGATSQQQQTHTSGISVLQPTCNLKY